VLLLTQRSACFAPFVVTVHFWHFVNGFDIQHKPFAVLFSKAATQAVRAGCVLMHGAAPPHAKSFARLAHLHKVSVGPIFLSPNIPLDQSSAVYYVHHPPPQLTTICKFVDGAFCINTPVSDGDMKQLFPVKTPGYSICSQLSAGLFPSVQYIDHYLLTPSAQEVFNPPATSEFKHWSVENWSNTF